jgi:putative ATP-dependent endonuclease of OLD family
MRVTRLRIENYRTLESLDLEFPTVYTAICGANDSGKTNVVRAIRALVRDDSGPFRYSEAVEPSVKDDYPKWSTTDPAARRVSFELDLALDSGRDAGFFEFVVAQLAMSSPEDPMRLSVSATYRPHRSEPEVLVTVAGKEYQDLRAQEVLRKLQSSTSILFHNSTETESAYIYGGGRAAGYVREISGQHEALVADLKKKVDKGLEKISKSQQTELEGLLGRLQTKYKVGLSMPKFDFGYMPFSITLGDKRIEVPLNDWGSGTRNRTLVLLTLFQARQIGGAEASAGKITPVIIVEEPESFLHPAAQAEFGRVLRDLAEEFQVQVIVTTHSPHLLNLQDPCANILLRRRSTYRQLRETQRVDTSGDNWMAPFGQALGLDAAEFAPWKEMMFSQSDAILLVEGDTDRAYWELLRDRAHGENQLVADCEIVAYGGTGSISNTVLLKFIQDRFARFFVTFDLDAAPTLERTMQSLQLLKGKHYLPVGVDAPGKKCIEGLLPSFVQQAVYAANPDLVQALQSANSDERKSASNRLKALLLAEFKNQATPGEESYSKFYPLVRAVNKAFAQKATVNHLTNG